MTGFINGHRGPYTPPRVTVQPPQASGSIRVVLNTRTGELYAIQLPPGPPTSFDGPYDPDQDLWRPAWGYERTPTRIGWDAYGWPWTRTVAGVAAQLARVAPIAQHLLDHLAPVPGTAGEWDWTPAATAAEDRIRTGISCTNRADDGFWMAPLPDRSHHGVVAMSELLEIAPELADPAWAAMSDEELDAVAGDWCGTPANPSGRYIPTHITELICSHYGFSASCPIYIVRSRIDLRAWRDAAIQARTELPTKPAEEYLGTAGDTTPVISDSGLTAATSDAELERIAARIDAEAAHRSGVALVGTAAYLRLERAAKRDRVRAELAAIGARCASLAAELQRLSEVRAALMRLVVAFREQPEWRDGRPNYAELGRLAGMTRQAARGAMPQTLTAEQETA